MARLKQDQLRYAKARVNQVMKEKLREIREWAEAATPPRLSQHEKMRLIREGKLDLVIPDDAGTYIHLIDCFVDPRDRARDERAQEVREQAKAACEAVEKRASEILDDLILGDAAEALQKIHEFEALSIEP